MALSSCGSAATDPRGRELLEHGTPLFPAACYHDNISEAGVPWHWHDELEVLVVETGTARVAVNGADRIVKRGEGCFINAGALHGVWPEGTETCRLHSVVFHPRLVGGSVDSIIWQKYLEPLLSDPCRPCVYFAGLQEWETDASGMIQEAWQACVSETEGFELTVRERLSRLIFLLAKHCPAAEKRPSEKALRDGERIKIMLQYIREHYAEELTLAEIARSAAVSKNECLRCFRGTIGASPIGYLKQLRVQKAAELLLSSGESVGEIGARCGFPDAGYFTRTFRKLKGCTPSAYRKSSPDVPPSPAGVT